MLAFVRSAGSERIVCAFNLGAREERVALPPHLAVSALAGHGFAGRLADGGGAIVLASGEGFFGGTN